jgi:ABC-type multidrug transport system fused ATPase/permease subunit
MLLSFYRLLVRCYRMVLPFGRLKLCAVLGLILFNGMLQLVGVTSIFPFFALAADPERIRKSELGGWILQLLPPMATNQLLVAAGCFAIVMLALASIGSLASEVLRVRYAYGLGHWLRGRMFASYASQSYAFFLRRNTADLNQRLFDVQMFIQNVLQPVGEILTRILLIVLMVGAVFLVQPWIALGAAVIFGGFYLAAFLWFRPHTRAVGEGFKYHNVGFWKNASQFLQGIKTVLVHGKGRYFMEQALAHSARIGHFQGKLPVYSNGPRYLIEPLAFGALVAVVVIMASKGRPFSDILPNLTVMAFAGYKLLPALQLLYSQMVTVSAYNYTLNHLEEEITELKSAASTNPAAEAVAPISFQREIRLEKLVFQYPGAAAPTVKDFHLTIRKNEAVGIAGPSGSGKSTLVDLLLGLHIPQSGRICVDDQPLFLANLPAWRHIIGYVPQDIYLLDDTVEANIAFGMDPKEVDAAALREAAQGAQILEFIERELPQGFQTAVGERGVRLSGGQRQRIGLARALYHRPQVLILDEATSALDNQTELAVMETIHRLQGTLTIITIAHRLSTLERCDRVVRLADKKIAERADA